MRLSFQARHVYPGGFKLDLNFETSELVTSLYGPSGSGKTNVLEIIAGLKRPAQGTVVLGERVLLDTRAGIDIAPQHRGVGMVFQQQFLFPHYTVNGNLCFGQKRHRQSSNRIDFPRVVEVLELGGLLERYPRYLSGGESQRVALGRALLSGPELLLLDEPLTGLDYALKNRVLDYIERAIREWQIPTLIVTHGQLEVKRLANRVIVLDRGQVVREADPENFHVPE